MQRFVYEQDSQEMNSETSLCLVPQYLRCSLSLNVDVHTVFRKLEHTLCVFLRGALPVLYSLPFPLAFLRPFLYDWDINSMYYRSSSLSSVWFSGSQYLHMALQSSPLSSSRTLSSSAPQNLILFSSHSPFLPLLNSSLFLDFQRLLKYLEVYLIISNAYSKYFHLCQFLYC